MSLAFETVKRIMDANENVAEIFAVAGSPLWVGFLKQQEKPIMFNGELITEAVERELVNATNILTVDDCISISDGLILQSEHVEPKASFDGYSVINTENGTIILTSPPFSFAISVHYRIFRNKISIKTA
jgi:hypothetical protein